MLPQKVPSNLLDRSFSLDVIFPCFVCPLASTYSFSQSSWLFFPSLSCLIQSTYWMKHGLHDLTHRFLKSHCKDWCGGSTSTLFRLQHCRQQGHKTRMLKYESCSVEAMTTDNRQHRMGRSSMDRCDTGNTTDGFFFQRYVFTQFGFEHHFKTHHNDMPYMVVQY